MYRLVRKKYYGCFSFLRYVAMKVLNDKYDEDNKVYTITVKIQEADDFIGPSIQEKDYKYITKIYHYKHSENNYFNECIKIAENRINILLNMIQILPKYFITKVNNIQNELQTINNIDDMDHIIHDIYDIKDEIEEYLLKYWDNNWDKNWIDIDLDDEEDLDIYIKNTLNNIIILLDMIKLIPNYFQDKITNINDNINNANDANIENILSDLDDIKYDIENYLLDYWDDLWDKEWDSYNKDNDEDYSDEFCPIIAISYNISFSIRHEDIIVDNDKLVFPKEKIFNVQYLGSEDKPHLCNGYDGDDTNIDTLYNQSNLLNDIKYENNILYDIIIKACEKSSENILQPDNDYFDNYPYDFKFDYEEV